MRASLSSTKGFAAILKEFANSLAHAEIDLSFDVIEHQANQMSGLITDLLDMARIDTATQPVAPVPSEPAVLVGDAMNTFLSRGDRNNIHIDLEPDMPFVTSDRRRIVQALGNFLSSAGKHSPES